MKLTKYHREAFVCSVMNDVPKVDYQEQLKAAIYKDLEKTLPPKVAAVFKDPALRCYVIDGHFNYRPAGVSNWGGGKNDLCGVSVPRDYEPTDGAVVGYAKIVEAADAQFATLAAMRQKVQGAIGSCTTRAKAVELMPEFEKYLPLDVEKSTMLPAIGNLVADLTEMGWPKPKTADVL